MQNLMERITVNPRQCGGRPCVRGMRIRVSDVLDLFASGLDVSQILAEMPDLFGWTPICPRQLLNGWVRHLK
jgi:uncharacterized protein (DUF433 family)